MACAETSCGHDGQKVQQFKKLSQLMGPLIGQEFQRSSPLTQVSRKDFKRITICDLGHIVLAISVLPATVFSDIAAGQDLCDGHWHGHEGASLTPADGQALAS
jgi:hypothetical protein